MDQNLHLHHYRKRVRSFKYATSGLITAVKGEPNLKFHLFAGVLAILASIFFRITKSERLVVILLIALVITLELLNTAIEVIVDSLTPVEHPAAKIAKDISAGAVLVVSVAATIIGLIIFLPFVFKL